MKAQTFMYLKRIEKGLSLAQLGELTGLTPPGIGQIENKKVRPRLDVAFKIADVLCDSDEECLKFLRNLLKDNDEEEE